MYMFYEKSQTDSKLDLQVIKYIFLYAIYHVRMDIRLFIIIDVTSREFE
jgi:hypothetical protein